MAEAAAHAVKAAFAALMAGGGTVFVILILIVGIIGGAVFLLCLAVWTERMAARFASLAALMDWNACFFCKIAWVFTF